MAHAEYTVSVTNNQFAYLIEAHARFQIEKLKIYSFNAFIKALLIEFPWNDHEMLASVIGDEQLFEKALHSEIRFGARFDDQSSKYIRSVRDHYSGIFGHRVTISSTILILAVSYLRSPDFAE